MSASPRDDDDDLFGDDEPVANGSNPNGEAPGGGEDDGPTLPEKEEKDLDDLFGSDDENGPPPSPPRRATSSAPTTPEGGHRERSRSGTPGNPLEYPEEEDNEGALEDRLMATLVPPIKRMESVDDKLWHLKLPSFVAVEPTPYNPDGFHKSASAKKEESQNGLQNDKKSAAADFLLAKNTIRWRWVDGPDGKPVRKSNARFVRWSDGSFSLQLSSDLFDVNASIPPTSAEDRSPSQTSSFPTFSSAADASTQPKASSIKPDELPVTYIAHSVPSSRMPNVLAIQAPIVGNLSLLPTSMSSKTHMELVSHIERQHARESKLKMLDEAQDRELMMKSEVGAEIKARMKVRSVQRTGSGGGGAGAFGRSGNSKKKAYDSDDSDGPTAGPGYGRRGAHRPTGGARAGRPIGVDAGEYDEDDGFVVADSDESDAQASGSGGSGDSDAYGGSSRKKKSKKSRKRDYSPDAVEDADRLIEAASREKREQKRARREAEGGRSSRSEKKEKRRAEKERKRSTRDYESGSDEDEGEAKMTDEGEADMDMDVETEED